MTASQLVTIFCDAENCGRWTEAGMGDTAREARAGAKRMGWRVAARLPERRWLLDYCPLHSDGSQP